MKPTVAKRKGTIPRTYWPNCSVCQYMRKHKDFRLRIMQSTYFDPQGTESMMDVVRAFGNRFPGSSMRTHMARHQQKDIIRAEARIQPAPIAPMLEMIEPSDVPLDPHEKSLDNFILEGDAKLQAGEMSITAQTYLTAIKIKADIQKSSKDRKVDVFKAMMGKASGINRKEKDSAS